MKLRVRWESWAWLGTLLFLLGCSTPPSEDLFPKTIVVDGHTLTFQGHGVRENNWGETFRAGLWLTTPSTRPAEIINAEEPKRWAFVWSGSWEQSRVVDSFHYGFVYHFPLSTLDQMQERLERFYSFFEGGVQKGAETAITYLPGRGTIVSHAGVEAGVIEGRDFMKLIWTGWFGPKRMSKGNPQFMRSLLGLDAQAAIDEASVEGAQVASDDRPAGIAEEIHGDRVAHRSVTIYCEGARLAGDLFWPKAADEGPKLPGIVMAQGWGGLKKALARAYAPKFAAAGFVVLTIDYRGWGESEGKLIANGPLPRPTSDPDQITIEARIVREIIDPRDQVEDLSAAVAYLSGELLVDPNRIGIWGSSFGGGHAVYLAATDDRIKCAVSQVGSMGGKNLGRLFQDKGGRSHFYDVATKRARGELAPVPRNGEDRYTSLPGTPDVWNIYRYEPRAVANRINVPLLIIDAEKEKTFKTEEHGKAVYETVKANSSAPVEYVLLSDATHTVAYGPRFNEVSDLEIEWFKKHL